MAKTFIASQEEFDAAVIARVNGYRPYISSGFPIFMRDTDSGKATGTYPVVAWDAVEGMWLIGPKHVVGEIVKYADFESAIAYINVTF